MSIEAKLMTEFTAKGTLTPADVQKIVGKKQYVSKYVLYLRLAGHDIVTHKDGRSVTKYVYTGVSKPVTIKATERRASGNAKATVVAPKPAPAPKAAKVPKPALSAVAKAKAAPAAKKPNKAKVVDEATKTFGTSGAVSSAVDPGWDAVDISDFKSLGAGSHND